MMEYDYGTVPMFVLYAWFMVNIKVNSGDGTVGHHSPYPPA